MTAAEEWSEPSAPPGPRPSASGSVARGPGAPGAWRPRVAPPPEPPAPPDRPVARETAPRVSPAAPRVRPAGGRAPARGRGGESLPPRPRERAWPDRRSASSAAGRGGTRPGPDLPRGPRIPGRRARRPGERARDRRADLDP